MRSRCRHRTRALRHDIGRARKQTGTNIAAMIKSNSPGPSNHSEKGSSQKSRSSNATRMFSGLGNSQRPRYARHQSAGAEGGVHNFVAGLGFGNAYHAGGLVESGMVAA